MDLSSVGSLFCYRKPVVPAQDIRGAVGAKKKDGYKAVDQKKQYSGQKPI